MRATDVDLAPSVKHSVFMVATSALLPPALISSLAEVGAKLKTGDDPARSLGAALRLLADIDPGDISRADGEIAAAADLYREVPQSPLRKLFSHRPSGASQLRRTPGLEYLFIFHRDGRLREAALLKITGGLPNPFLLAAVVWRLNDWVEPVRQAAARCANRSFFITDPDVVARTAAELLVRQASWRRWRDERAILDQVFGRSDVAAKLADLMAGATTGPQASTLRQALRTPALDPHLEKLALSATQPAVRAVALATLIDGKAEWPSGTAWRWIDKTYGVRRRETTFDHRPLTEVVSRRTLIARGVTDKSAVVRRVALTGIIRHMLDAADVRGWAASLVSDRSKSVREKAEFILQRQ